MLLTPERKFPVLAYLRLEDAFDSAVERAAALCAQLVRKRDVERRAALVHVAHHVHRVHHRAVVVSYLVPVAHLRGVALRPASVRILHPHQELNPLLDRSKVLLRSLPSFRRLVHPREELELGERRRVVYRAELSFALHREDGPALLRRKPVVHWHVLRPAARVELPVDDVLRNARRLGGLEEPLVEMRGVVRPVLVPALSLELEYLARLGVELEADGRKRILRALEAALGSAVRNGLPFGGRDCGVGAASLRLAHERRADRAVGADAAHAALLRQDAHLRHLVLVPLEVEDEASESLEVLLVPLSHLVDAERGQELYLAAAALKVPPRVKALRTGGACGKRARQSQGGARNRCEFSHATILP